MSRRTKLIITAIFLVLLGIPLAHVFWSWRPENPLCFSIVAQTLPSFGHGPFRERVLVVEVRNTSHVPVYLSDAKLLAFNPSRGRRHVFVELEKFLLGPGSTSAYDPFKPRLAPIPPGGIRRTEVHVPDDAASQFHHTAPTIDYVYFSETKHTAFDLSRWLMEKVPLRFARHVPKPRTDTATIPLEYSLPSP
ncbi:MAG: hypothetical protein ACAH88_10355 [Roseimicrobium sp.]